MEKVKIYFEIRNGGVDDKGNPVPAGAVITLGETAEDIDYDAWAADINMSAVADFLKVKPGDLRIITPEEYKEKYEDEEE